MEVDVGSQDFDLESYANNYTGHGKLNRLLFVAKTSKDAALRLEALQLAADEAKKGQNTVVYSEIIAAIAGKLDQNYAEDREWIDNTNKAAIKRQESLETELNGYKTNLIKESIRLGHNELGNHHYTCGRLTEAFKCYVRTRDYCTTSKHHWQACLNAIRVSIELGQFPHVNNYITKAEQFPDIKVPRLKNNANDVKTVSPLPAAGLPNEDGPHKAGVWRSKGQPDVLARLAAAGGLSALEGKRYKVAARKFSEVNAELGTQWNNVIAPQDIALYGGLCGLAFFNRRELREHIIENVQFREYLEVYPEVREIVSDFYGSKYASCLTRLQRLGPALHLDMYLSAHATELLDAVRSKALVQYTAPFVSVHLPTMATAFNIDRKCDLKQLRQSAEQKCAFKAIYCKNCFQELVDAEIANAPYQIIHAITADVAWDLEDQIAELIQAGQIQARIDSDSQVLHKRRANVRSTIFATALQASDEYLAETRALLLRANLQRHDLIQKAGPGSRRAKGGERGDTTISAFLPVGPNAWENDRESPLGSFEGLD